MKTILPTMMLAISLGCSTKPEASRVSELPQVVRATEKSFAVLRDTPDKLLNEMAKKYAGNNAQWQDAWKLDHSKTAIDGQQAIRLLEIACYADVTCHPTEYPLCVATLDFVESNLTTSDVSDALHWVRESYKSGLPLDAPDDETGQFRGTLVEAMNIRMSEYAKHLLDPDVPSQHRDSEPIAPKFPVLRFLKSTPLGDNQVIGAMRHSHHLKRNLASRTEN